MNLMIFLGSLNGRSFLVHKQLQFVEKVLLWGVKFQLIMIHRAATDKEVNLWDSPPELDFCDLFSSHSCCPSHVSTNTGGSVSPFPSFQRCFTLWIQADRLVVSSSWFFPEA
jgi:hypothetical protein